MPLYLTVRTEHVTSEPLGHNRVNLYSTSAIHKSGTITEKREQVLYQTGGESHVSQNRSLTIEVSKKKYNDGIKINGFKLQLSRQGNFTLRLIVQMTFD